MSTINIINSGAGAYLIDGASNGTISLVRGNTYNLVINASGHPFWIQTVAGAYSSGNVYSSGVTNNGTAIGTITFVVPYNAPNTLYYVCQFHSAMQGTINITDAPWVTDLTANTLDATYIIDYLDVSGGSITIRDPSHNLITGTGDVSLNGTTTFAKPFIYNTDLSLNKRLFVVGDVSMVSGRLYVASNASITGRLYVASNNYKAGSISNSAINSGGGGGGGTYTINTDDTTFSSDMSYNNAIKLNGDVSLNSTTQISAATTLKVRNMIRFNDGTTIASTNRLDTGVFKDSSFNNMTVTGTFTSLNAVEVPSDYRIKTNVQSLDETHVLDKLRPVAYYQTQAECNDIGFIAHELQEHYPELVEGIKDGDKMQSVDYNGILVLLINEIQRLKQFIKDANAEHAVQAVQVVQADETVE
jgi:hypothetical protein